MTRRYSSGWICSNGANTEVNATFTHTSIGPEFVLDPVGGGENLRLVGHIGLDHQGGAAAGPDVLGGAGQAFLAAGQQRDTGAAGAERRGDGAADAAAGPGHHHHLCSS